MLYWRIVIGIPQLRGAACQIGQFPKKTPHAFIPLMSLAISSFSSTLVELRLIHESVSPGGLFQGIANDSYEQFCLGIEFSHPSA